MISARRCAAILGIGLVSACSPTPATALDICDAVPESDITALIGEAESVAFALDPLAECRWVSIDDPTQEVVVRIETVPDAELFFEHSIEGTDPDRVQRVDLAEGAAILDDEAALARVDDQIVLITGTVDTEQLVPLLEASVEFISAS